jgi:2-succinyl-5-enolpyruvyl-6-hydroxy-3-cyclohexene-1-carboxylate synthase
MSTADDAYAISRAFVAGLAAAGVRDVAVCAGSRSTGMALAAIDDGHLNVTTHLDERSAGFFAVGAARATGHPAAVVTTSGTAAANLLPAVVEARYAGIPITCITCDRPTELADAGASQTIDQSRLLSAARWHGELLTHEEAGAEQLRRSAHLGVQAVASALDPRGPVQVNVRFREPLTPSREARAAGLPGRLEIPISRGPLGAEDARDVADAAGTLKHASRGLIHCGHIEFADPSDVDRLASSVAKLSRASGYPVVAEATSRLRGRLGDAVVVHASESLVRDVGFSSPRFPQAIVRIGAAPLTRAFAEWIEGVPQVTLAGSFPWPDPNRDARVILRGDPASTCASIAATLAEEGEPDDGWSADWAAAQRVAGGALGTFLDQDAMFEGSVAAAVLGALPEDAILYSATSLPIRAVDAFWTTDRPIDVLANRGANGIDGTVSSAIGAASATGRPVVCLAGDLALLHDVGGMLAASRLKVPVVIVVIDNDGGGIFEFLPQANGLDRETFERLFTVSHRRDLMYAAELYGFSFAAARDTGALDKALRWAFTEGGSWVIRVPVNRAASVDAHAGAWDAVARALREEM